MLILLLLLFLLGFSQASAQTTPPAFVQPEVVATVNIYNAAVTPHEGESFTVSFDIFNRQGVQSQIKYGISLTKSENNGSILIDQNIYPETLTLSANQTVHKQITYTPPAYLNGQYQLWVESRNPSGFVFGIALAGGITLNGDNQYLEIKNNSCYLTVKGETPPQQYNLSQGVDISANETLTANCLIKNHFSNTVTVQPNFELHRRTTFGPGVGKNFLPPISFQPNEKKLVALDIPKQTQPQAYDAVLTFLDPASNSPISNAVIAHFVLQGESATIQNVIFDKASYQSGDTAKVTLTFTPSADVFPQSRGAGTSLPRAAMKMVVWDAVNQSDCSPTLTQVLDASKDNQTFALALISDCQEPVIAVSLVDPQGNLLDQSSFGNGASQQAQPITQPLVLGSNQNPNISSPSRLLLIILIVIILAVIAIAIFYFTRSSRGKGKIPKVSIFLFTLLASVLSAGNVARADTFSMSYLEHGYDWVTSYFSASVNKQAYGPGEAVIASGAGWGGQCVNGYQNLVETVIFPSEKRVTLFAYDNYGGPGYLAGGASDPAPQKPGQYVVRFLGAGYGHRNSPGIYDIPITVVPSNSPPTLNFSGPAIVSVLNSIQLIWQSTNADSCTASGHWSGSKSIAGAESVSKPRGSYSFNLACSGAGGTVSQTVNVTVVQCSFSGATPIHALPQPLFTWSPKNISPNQTVTFDASSTTFAAGARNKTYAWDWSGGQPLTAATGPSANPVAVNKFAGANGTAIITLTAADDAGSCWATDTLTIRPPLPKYQEVNPAAP